MSATLLKALVLARCCCFFERGLLALSYSQSAQDVWWWSFLPISAKHLILFPWMHWGGRSTAWVTTSTSRLLFRPHLIVGYLLHALTKRHP
jgi:hypothetical protein